MMRKTKTKTIVIATVITTLLSATAAFADNTTSSNTVQAPKFSQTHSCEAHGWFKSRLDSLVKAGTLTQAQEVAIQSAITTAKGEFKRGDNGGFKTVLDRLVKAGTITQAQEDAIQGSSD